MAETPKPASWKDRVMREMREQGALFGADLPVEEEAPATSVRAARPGDRSMDTIEKAQRDMASDVYQGAALAPLGMGKGTAIGKAYDVGGGYYDNPFPGADPVMLAEAVEGGAALPLLIKAVPVAVKAAGQTSIARYIRQLAADESSGRMFRGMPDNQIDDMATQIANQHAQETARAATLATQSRLGVKLGRGPTDKLTEIPRSMYNMGISSRPRTNREAELLRRAREQYEMGHVIDGETVDSFFALPSAQTELKLNEYLIRALEGQIDDAAIAGGNSFRQGPVAMPQKPRDLSDRGGLVRIDNELDGYTPTDPTPQPDILPNPIRGRRPSLDTRSANRPPPPQVEGGTYAWQFDSEWDDLLREYPTQVMQEGVDDIILQYRRDLEIGNTPTYKEDFMLLGDRAEGVIPVDDLNQWGGVLDEQIAMLDEELAAIASGARTDPPMPPGPGHPDFAGLPNEEKAAIMEGISRRANPRRVDTETYRDLFGEVLRGEAPRWRGDAPSSQMSGPQPRMTSRMEITPEVRAEYLKFLMRKHNVPEEVIAMGDEGLRNLDQDTLIPIMDDWTGTKFDTEAMLGPSRSGPRNAWEEFTSQQTGSNRELPQPSHLFRKEQPEWNFSPELDRAARKAASFDPGHPEYGTLRYSLDEANADLALVDGHLNRVDSGAFGDDIDPGVYEVLMSAKTNLEDQIMDLTRSRNLRSPDVNVPREVAPTRQREGMSGEAARQSEYEGYVEPGPPIRLADEADEMTDVMPEVRRDMPVRQRPKGEPEGMSGKDLERQQAEGYTPIPDELEETLQMGLPLRDRTRAVARKVLSDKELEALREQLIIAKAQSDMDRIAEITQQIESHNKLK